MNVGMSLGVSRSEHQFACVKMGMEEFVINSEMWTKGNFQGINRLDHHYIKLPQD